MKRIFLFLAIFAIATTFVFGQSKDEQEIRKLFAATAEAIAKNDVAALSNYYADDLTFTVADGRTVNKTQFLDFVKNSKRESFDFSDLKIRTFGNTAVVNFTRTSTAVNADGSKSNSQSRDTATLVKNGGGWQIVALQISNEMANNQAGGSTEQEIRQTLDKMADALTRNDADAMANYWADNHTFFNRNGMLTTKAQRIANLKSAQPRPGAFKYEDINIRMLGNTAAVVTARPTYPIKFANGQTITVSDRATMRFTKTMDAGKSSPRIRVGTIPKPATTRRSKNK
ncbi:MAG: nuclear transport factor 2 family protein [Acidobacteriota bacterium]|nr:nuclear transport factor 2 family protein [Acidobacteriota bacterium]